MKNSICYRHITSKKNNKILISKLEIYYYFWKSLNINKSKRIQNILEGYLTK